MTKSERKAFLNKTYAKFFKPDECSNSDLYSLNIVNSNATVTGLIWNSREECEICRKVHKDNCQFNYKDNMTLKQVMQKWKSDRDFELSVEWVQNPVGADLNLIENPIIQKIDTI
jgi:hypothetical protein